MNYVFCQGLTTVLESTRTVPLHAQRIGAFTWPCWSWCRWCSWCRCLSWCRRLSWCRYHRWCRCRSCCKCRRWCRCWNDRGTTNCIAFHTISKVAVLQNIFTGYSIPRPKEFYLMCSAFSFLISKAMHLISI